MQGTGVHTFTASQGPIAWRSCRRIKPQTGNAYSHGFQPQWKQIPSFAPCIRLPGRCIPMDMGDPPHYDVQTGKDTEIHAEPVRDKRFVCSLPFAMPKNSWQFVP